MANEKETEPAPQNVIDMLAQRKQRAAAQQQVQQSLQQLAAATVRRPQPIVIDGRRVQYIDAVAPDALLMTVMMYADKSMSLLSAGMNRSYTAAQIAKAAAASPTDEVAEKLADAAYVGVLVRSLVQRGLASTAGDTFKLTAAGVMIGKSFRLSPERMPLVAALD